MKLLGSVPVLLVALITLFLLPVSILGRAVVGIDLGSTNVRMGMLRSGVGSVETVLNFESERKTIAAVGYRDGQTLFSQTAMNMVSLEIKRRRKSKVF
jgi:molecular chaperone DnaK (HSP70)